MYDSNTNIIDTNVSQEDKMLAIIAHALVLVGPAVAFGQIIGPLVIWLIKKDESEFIADHAKEALNFAISLMIYTVVCIILTFVFIGFVLLIALGIFTLIVTIISIIKTSEGKYYRYPFCIRLVN